MSIRKGVAATAMFVLVVELTLRVAYFTRDRFIDAVPLPYTLGDDYGPLPPWVDSSRMLEPDDRLIWRSRAGFRASYVGLFIPFASDQARLGLVRRFSPRLPASLQDRTRWDVALDARGFREAEFSDRKAPGAFRILCLGDSWTFGANVPQADTYPRQLERLLERRFPGARFEVLNLGVLGYSSFQGRELLRAGAIDWDPDLVIVGFGMNDGKVGFRDDQLAASPRTAQLAAAKLLERSELYKLLRYWALRLRYRPPATADVFRAKIASDGWAREQRAVRHEPLTRVSLAAYEQNLRAVIELARAHGAGVILLDNEIDEGPYTGAMARVADEASVPLVRGPLLIALARQRKEDDRARRLGLRENELRDTSSADVAIAPDAARDVRVVFRVYADSATVPKSLYIVGAHPSLGDLVPNRIALHDDGEGEDERRGDGVWTVSASLPAGSTIHYAYTNSGREGSWEGMDVPAVRRFVVPTGTTGVDYRPVESFGAIDLQSDSWHTDAEGLGAIAQAVVALLERDARVQRYVQDLGGRPSTASVEASSQPGA